MYTASFFLDSWMPPSIPWPPWVFWGKRRGQAYAVGSTNHAAERLREVQHKGRDKRKGL